MSTIPRVGSMHDVKRFAAHVNALAQLMPVGEHLLLGEASPLAKPLVRGEIRLGIRITVQPMEGWDGTCDGRPTENTIRRWRRFGRSGAKLIWGGVAVAVLE